MGSRSEEEARAASRKVGRTLQKLVARFPEVCKKKRGHQQDLRVRDFQMRIIWANTQLPWDIRMQVSLSSE